MTSRIRTEIGAANAERITLRGHDLVDTLIGQVSFTEAALLAITGNRPSPAQVRVADAVLVTFIDHGLQPSALAARLTYYVAPEAMQAAIAAGLLGVGSKVLGTMEQTGRLLSDIADDVAAGSSEDDAVTRAVAALIATGQPIPGLGHALHKGGDPRAAALLSVAGHEGVGEVEIARLHAVVAATSRATGKELPINAAGAAGALLLAIGIPWSLHRGISLISRTAGLVAHVGEEARDPITPAVRDELRSASWLVD